MWIDRDGIAGNNDREASASVRRNGKLLNDRPEGSARSAGRIKSGQYAGSVDKDLHAAVARGSSHDFSKVQTEFIGSARCQACQSILQGAHVCPAVLICCGGRGIDRIDGSDGIGRA